jgi:photosystem II stability/assembly factor-like uncharacterized protein
VRRQVLAACVLGLVLVTLVGLVASGVRAEAHNFAHGQPSQSHAHRPGTAAQSDSADPPSALPSGFTTTWWSGGPVGAAINAIAIDPTESDNVYVGTFGGGIYRSTDGAETWDAIPDDPVNGMSLGHGDGRIMDLVAAQGVLYAATEGGTGWFHGSTDGGTTWSHTTGQPYFAYGISAHPTVTTTVYAATDWDGVWTSTTAGQSWVNTDTGMDPGEWINEVAINPVTPTIMYSASGYGKIYKTTDGGATWNDSSTGLPGDIVWAAAVNPMTPTVVYAGLEAEGVWRSPDGGAHWFSWSGGDICPYVRDIVVDPADPETVYIGTDCTGVFMRTEGDPSWTSVGPSYTTGQRRVYAIGMTGDAPDMVLAGIWGDGVYKSLDGGQSWEARNVNLSALSIHEIRTDPTDPGTVYATADGGLFRTTDAGSGWDRIRDTQGAVPLYSDAFGLAIEEATGRVYIGMYAGTLIASDDGLHWFDAGTGLSSRASVTDIAIDQTDPDYLYAVQPWGPSDERGIYTSADRAGTWVRASTGITDTWVRSVAVDPNSPQNVYAGTSSGNVFRSTNRAQSWTWSGTGVIVDDLYAPEVTAIVPDPQTPGVVYLTQSNGGQGGLGGVYKSADYGATWDRVLEGHDPQALVLDPLNPQVLIAASWNDHLYRSEDGGETWSVYDADAFDGYPYTKALAIGVAGGVIRLYAGTGTNSVWQRDVYPGVFVPLVTKEY